MTVKEEKQQLIGIAKILDLLWDNSYNIRRMDKRIEVELIYYFGKNWAKDMYDFIGFNGTNPEMPRPLKKFK